MSLKFDNVFRILKGDPEIQPVRCRLGFHRWSKWKYHEPHGDFMSGRSHVAESTCVDCNMPRFERPYTKTLK